MCRNTLIDKLVEECTKFVDYNETLNEIPSNDSLSDCVSCTPCIVLFAVFLVTSVIIGCVFIYFHWYLKESNDQLSITKDNVRVKLNPITQIANY